MIVCGVANSWPRSRSIATEIAYGDVNLATDLARWMRATVSAPKWPTATSGDESTLRTVRETDSVLLSPHLTPLLVMLAEWQTLMPLIAAAAVLDESAQAHSVLHLQS